MVETVAVTGASGSFGKVVVRHLSRLGHVVHAIDRVAWPDCPSDVTFHRCDILKRGFDDVLRQVRPQAIVHLAMIHRFAHSRQRRFRVNYEGTARTIRLSYKMGVKKLVLGSRATVYGALPDAPQFVTEEHPPAAGRTMADMQDLVDADLYATSMLWRYQDAEMNILRFVNVLGDGVTTLLQRYLLQRRVFTVMGFDPMIQVMHQEDMARAVALALRPGLRGIWNVAGPGSVPLHVLVEESGGRRVPLPESAIVMLKGRLGFPDIPPGAVEYLKHDCTVDDSAFRDATGYEPDYGLRAILGALADKRRQRHLR